MTKHVNEGMVTTDTDGSSILPTSTNFDDGESSAPKRKPNRDHAPERERSEGNKGKEDAEFSVAPSSFISSPQRAGNADERAGRPGDGKTCKLRAGLLPPIGGNMIQVSFLKRRTTATSCGRGVAFLIRSVEAI